MREKYWSEYKVCLEAFHNTNQPILQGALELEWLSRDFLNRGKSFNFCISDAFWLLTERSIIFDEAGLFHKNKFLEND